MRGAWPAGAAVLVLVGLVWPAAPPSRPAGRPLTGPEAERAAALERQVSRHWADGRFAEALKSAEALAALRQRAQGPVHWQEAEARWLVEALRKALRASPADRQALQAVLGWGLAADDLEHRGHYLRAQPLREKALRARLAVLGPAHPHTAESYNNLAFNLGAQGKQAQAQPLHEKALAINRKALGEGHPRTATNGNNLALCLQAQGQYARAQPLFEKALAVRLAVLGKGHPSTANSYTNLALVLTARGKHEQAQPLLEKALAVYLSAFGNEHLRTATGYNNLAGSLAEQGKYSQAQPLYEKALTVLRKVLGEEHPQTALSYNNVAANLGSQGQHARARPLYEKALAIQRKVLGEGHPATALSYNNLAHNLGEQGRPVEALPLARKALAIRRAALGEGHPDTAQSYNNVAFYLEALGRPGQAQPLYQKALALRRKALGEDHPDTAASYNNVAFNLHSQGKYAEALPLYEKALAIYRKGLGEGHPTTAGCWNNVALCLSSQGRHAQALPLYRRALAIHRRALGEGHPDTANSYNNLAGCLGAQGRHAEAVALLEKALAVHRKVLGEGHPLTARGISNLAFHLQAQGKAALALPLHEKALAIDRKALGEEHPEVARSYTNLGGCLQELGKVAQAQANFEKALAIYRKGLGEDHPHTADGYHNLAANLAAQGRPERAEEEARKAARAFVRARPHFAATGLGRAARAGTHSPLPFLAALLAGNGKAEEAWQWYEGSLARGTCEELAARLRWPDEERDRLAEIDARLGRLDGLVARTFSAGDRAEGKKRREGLLAQRVKALDEREALRRRLGARLDASTGRALARAEIQKELPAHVALVGWVDEPHGRAREGPGERWAVLLRAKGGPVWARLTGTGPKGAWTGADSELPGRLWAALTARRGDWQGLARQLRRQRLGPLEKHLVGVRHLVVLPSSALAGLPVEVLAEGRTVSYAPSGTLLAHLRRKPPARTAGLLAVADPAFATGGEPWKALPGARVEARALAGLFGAGAAHLLTGPAASAQRLADMAHGGELGKYRYLHLATHGRADWRFPLRSAVILSRNNLPGPLKQRNGRLTAEEVLRSWKLDCDLVALSACQTALGTHSSGEGFLGFGQAFVLAGSRAVVLSLWSVDDEATALLMVRFYRNLLGKRPGLKRPMPKAEALQEAKDWLRNLSAKEVKAEVERLPRGKAAVPVPLRKEARPFAHPYYWAAFVLVGDPN